MKKNEKGGPDINDGIEAKTLLKLLPFSFIHGFFRVKAVSPRSEGGHSFLCSCSSHMSVPLTAAGPQTLQFITSNFLKFNHVWPFP